MPVTLGGNIAVNISITDSRTAIAGAANEQGTRLISQSGAWGILPGTGLGQADKVWSDTRSVASGATDSLDLAGVLTDSFGAVVTFVKIRAVVIIAGSGNTTTIQFARPATLGSTILAPVSSSVAAVAAGGVAFFWMDPNGGVTVAAGSSDVINVINSAGPTATYTITVAGTSA